LEVAHNPHNPEEVTPRCPGSRGGRWLFDLGSFRLALAEEGSSVEDAWGYAVPRGVGVVGAIQSTMIGVKLNTCKHEYVRSQIEHMLSFQYPWMPGLLIV
jgi:hypothetical protein